MAKENAATTTKGEGIVKNDKGLLFDPSKDKLVVIGTLTAFRHSTTKYKKDQEYYQVSVLTDSLTPEVIEAIKVKYYSNTIDKYLPSFIKDADKDGTSNLYINLKSQFEFSSFIEGKGNERYGYDQIIELGEGLPPIGSDVKLSMRLKEGGVYPMALMFTKIKKQDVNDFFE